MTTPPSAARRGLRLLVGRDFVQQIVAFGGGIVVARILGPGPIGTYGIGLFVVTLLAMLGDVGLRTALLRQPGGVSRKQLGTCFAVHQMAGTVLVLGLIGGAGAAASLTPHAQPELAPMLRLLAFDLYLRIWRTVAEVRLERTMRYSVLAAADVAGTTCHHLVAVALTLMGAGAMGLAWAAVGGSLVRTVVVSRAAHWPPRLSFDGGIAWQLVRAGLPLQAIAVLGQTPHWISPTVVAAAYGPEAVGLLSCAAALGRKPLDLLENAVRVSLPHLARVQRNRHEITRLVTWYLTLAIAAYGAWISALVVCGRDLIAVLYGERWLPAAPALVLFAVGGLVLAVQWLVQTALIALGRAGLVTRAAAVAAIVTAGASIALVVRFGIVGVPLGQLVGGLLVTPWLLRAIGGAAPIRPWGIGRPVALAAAASVAAGVVLQRLLPGPAVVRLLSGGAAVAVVYAAIAWRAAPGWLRLAVVEEWSALGGRFER